MNFKELLFKFEKIALERDLEPSAIKLLLLEETHFTPTEMYTSLEETVSEEFIETFTNKINKYLYDNVPIQHIIGYDYFYGYKLKVSNEVLIPRFETEELVSYTLSYYDDLFKGKKIKLVDVGTGSGAIAIALAKEEKNLDVSATDISASAINIAKENAKNNDASITFYIGDMLEPLNGLKFDILVSNPPYIPDNDNISSLVKDNEPHLALFGGEDGLKYYRIILRNARRYLNDKYLIAFEHGYNMKEAIQALAKEYYPEAKIETIKDLEGKDRMTFIYNK